ncbi:MAG: hypothetical protein U0L74_03050 [Paludibacteraceae bacterium]|nr:hypothetical protein [Paludibacteraceae bacterium]
MQNNNNGEIEFNRQKRITLIYCVRSNIEMAECNVLLKDICEVSNEEDVITLTLHSYETIAKSISEKIK